MKHSEKVVAWYSEQAGHHNHRYVVNLSTKLREIREHGIDVAHHWLKANATELPKSILGNRCEFWMLTINLTYAEWKRDESRASEILEIARHYQRSISDKLTSMMFEVLEIACLLTLDKVTIGRIRTIFPKYHERLLQIIDELMRLDMQSVIRHAFIEDCQRIFDVAGDIEKHCGESFYLWHSRSDNIDSGVVNILEFPINKKRSKYLTHWFGHKWINKTQRPLEELLEHIEVAQHYVAEDYGFDPAKLFLPKPDDNCCELLNKDIIAAMNSTSHELKSLNLNVKQKSFWNLYIELVVHRAIVRIGNNICLSEPDMKALQQAARLPLHEQILTVVKSLISNRDFLGLLLSKHIIGPESLLYGLFAWLSSIDVNVVYSGNNILTEKNKPKFSRHCFNGQGQERIYTQLARRAYKILHNKAGTSQLLELSTTTGLSLQMDYGCVFTGKQIITVGIDKHVELGQQQFEGKEALAGLFKLVGFEFIRDKVILIHGPRPHKATKSKIGHCNIATANLRTGDRFVRELVKQEARIISVLPKHAMTMGRFCELVDAARVEFS